uniref:t-SNARE coiled-coil homology domain-containing protein n=1 Tax=Rhabditophanes sp. KR3021 TaxID=114890 RepID=A0AC35U4E7_9BILA
MASKRKNNVQDSAKHIILGRNLSQSKTNLGSTKIRQGESSAPNEFVYRSEPSSVYDFQQRLSGNKKANGINADDTTMALALFDFQRNLTNVETKQSIQQSDMNNLKMVVIKHDQELSSHDTIHRIKQVDTKVKTIQSQVSNLTKSLEKEISERDKFRQTHVEAYNRLQEHVKSQAAVDKSTINTILSDVQSQNKNMSSKMIAMNVEFREIDKAMQELDQNFKNLEKDKKMISNASGNEIKALKKELMSNLLTTENKLIDKADKTAKDILIYEKNIKLFIDRKVSGLKSDNNADHNTLTNTLNSLRTNTEEKIVNIERSLAKVEKNLNKNSEEVNDNSGIRKKHEDVMLKKINSLDSHVNDYIKSVKENMEKTKKLEEAASKRPKSRDSLRTSKNSNKNDSLTHDAIKQELIDIVNEKEKLSYQGMLIVEDKILNIQLKLEEFRKDFDKNTSNDDIKNQMNSFEVMIKQVESSQAKLHEKLESEIPGSLGEMTSKTNNAIKAMDIKYKQELKAMETSLRFLNKESFNLNKELDISNKARSNHENLILKKINKLEESLKDYITNQTTELNAIKEGTAKAMTTATSANSKKQDAEMDLDKMRHELTNIINEKSKLTYQLSLTIEEKVLNMQTMMSNFRKELNHKFNSVGLNDPRVIDLQRQMANVSGMMNDMETAHKQMKERLDDEIPGNMEEMSIKVKNALKILGERVSQEEEERFLAIKELQDVYTQMIAREKSGGKKISELVDDVKEDVDGLRTEVSECKAAVKKLAETMNILKNNIESQIGVKKK